MGKIAMIFPGQASQYPGMGKDLAEKFPAARAVFDEADKVLGFPISRMCFEGSEEELKQTANTQPAILAVSVAAFRVLTGKDGGQSIHPDYVAGHSLGEYSALVAAGALCFADALRLVRQRGTFMQEAVPAGEGAMAAIMGLSSKQVTEICRRASDGQIVSPANLNSAEQTVISGHAAAVKRAVELASQDGAKRAVVLAVSAPFHCVLMQPSQARMEPALAATQFHDPRIPLVTNADAEIITTGAEARDALVRQITLPVRWEDSIRELVAQGVTAFVEVGPGRVLSGLLRQIDRSVHSLNVEDEATLRSAQSKLEQIGAEKGDN
jgi:[acyl-carrier-protein] S-malonyltransferase